MSWPLVQLEEICEINIGKTPSRSNSSYWGGEEPWLSISDMNQGKTFFETKEKITFKAIKECNMKIVVPGTVLFSFKLSIGKVGRTSIPMYTNEAIASLPIKNEDLIDPRYLMYYLKEIAPNLTGDRAVMGATLNKQKLKEIKISLPPVNEQRRIAKILDQSTNLQIKQNALKKTLLNLEKNIFVDFFGDPLFNPKSLPLVPLEKLGKLGRGISKHRPRNDPSLLGGPYPLVQTGDISNSYGIINSFHSTYSELGKKQSKLWEKGTLCITIAANIAKTGILEVDACFPDSIVGFTSENPDNIYYVRTWLSFLQKTLEQQAPESAQKNINLRLLRELKVPYPPLDQMRRFSFAVKSLEKLKLKANEKTKRLNHLFASLSTKLLNVKKAK